MAGSTENEMADSERGDPVQKGEQGSNCQPKPEEQRSGTDCQGWSKRPSSAQNWQAASLSANTAVVG